MRKLVLLLSVFTVVTAALVVQPTATFAGPAGEKAVLAAVDAWKDAMLKKDRAALEKLFHADLSYTHSSATVETKAQAIPHIVDGLGWEAIEFSDTTVRLYGNTAVVNGKLDMHQRNKDKPTSISKLISLTVWVKGPQGWQMIARQAVRRPDDEQVIAAKAAVAAMKAAPKGATATAPAAK
jgi:ketosteroid isomerase-like protein